MENPWEQGENQRQLNPHVAPGHIGGRRALSPLHHPFSPASHLLELKHRSYACMRPMCKTTAKQTWRKDSVLGNLHTSVFHSCNDWTILELFKSHVYAVTFRRSSQSPHFVLANYFIFGGLLLFSKVLPLPDRPLLSGVSESWNVTFHYLSAVKGSREGEREKERCIYLCQKPKETDRVGQATQFADF